MPLTTGRTKVQEVALELGAAASSLRGSLHAQVLLITKAMEMDAKDDPLLQRADDELKAALELSNPTDVHSRMLRARAALIGAKDIDFKDATLPALLAMVQDQERRMESIEAQSRDLMGDLCHHELRRRAA